ncbi:MAG: enoyl-CoA hydratase/isomerase family protein, partial [Acidimicrobiales bacterium]|nr:enoyl-CoA hydratase/isomerase family protein [Acidimicrobiales bacterium]
MAATHETLVVERHGPVGWLVFDRPAAGNAMDATMLDELERAWRELDDDPEVRVIVNTGAGRNFQTGLDVVQLSRDPEALREQSRRTERAELRISAWHNAVATPVVAAVNGTCAGGGLHFVADADIVIAAADAAFVDPHVSVGQVTAFEAIALARKAPFEAIMRMALMGRHERMSARRAYELGMVSEVVDPPERLRERAQELAETIARNSPAAMGPGVDVGPPRPDRGPGGVRREAQPGLGDRSTDSGRSPMSTYTCLRIERHGPVGWLINDRPDQLNAMNNTMRDEFADAWLELDADPAVRVIVHTGNGRAFQTGVDVSEIAGDGVGMERYRESMENFDVHFTAWHQGVAKPVITAVNGLCAGGAFHWVADADVVIAAADAQFFDPHVSVGQVVAIEAIGLLRKMPFEAVMRMALMGRHERMSAQRAYELGMVSEVVDPPERLRERAQELAETIARNSPAAM